jgi:hypothetical protein
LQTMVTIFAVAKTRGAVMTGTATRATPARSGHRNRLRIVQGFRIETGHDRKASQSNERRRVEPTSTRLMGVLLCSILCLGLTTPSRASDLAAIGLRGLESRLHVQKYTPVPRPEFVQQTCGPPNCCLNPQCRQRYQSEWKPDMNKCGGCSVQ